MRKIILILILIDYNIFLSAQITKQDIDRDGIVLEHIENYSHKYIIYAKVGLQTEIIIVTPSGEKL